LRVLVVDDNVGALETLTTGLDLLGAEVRAASDGQLALGVGADFQPDVVLMDLGMPNMNGYEAARRMRELPWGAESTLVAITGWEQPEHKQRAAAAGFDEHLVKPVRLSDLARLLGSRTAHDAMTRSGGSDPKRTRTDP
jgi:CheY-like chemotaxis protein